MQTTWQSVTALPKLSPDELQIWRIALPSGESDGELHTQNLNAAEIDRAARFRVNHARLQFVVARAALRVLLGTLLSVDPKLVGLEIGPHGKPAVTGHPLQFNLAHTDGIVLIALSPDGNVGIDVERISREVEALDIARSSFSSGETRDLESIADIFQLQNAFFHCWTRKEAIIKADGRGLSLPLASFSVPVTGKPTFAPVEVTQPVRSSSGSQSKTFYVSDLPCGNEFAAAVAVELPRTHLHLFDFPLQTGTNFPW